MKRIRIAGILMIALIAGCDMNNGPDFTGEIELSSEFFGTETYYIYGYNFHESEFIKYYYPFNGPVIPDIINEPFDNPDGSIAAPGFNTPSNKNGFNLLGEFQSIEESRTFYNNYVEVEEGLSYSLISDTVKLNQVWIQKTQLDHYVKMLVKDIDFFSDTQGSEYVVVTIDFTYQDDGSRTFPR